MLGNEHFRPAPISPHSTGRLSITSHWHFPFLSTIHFSRPTSNPSFSTLSVLQLMLSPHDKALLSLHPKPRRQTPQVRAASKSPSLYVSHVTESQSGLCLCWGKLLPCTGPIRSLLCVSSFEFRLRLPALHSKIAIVTGWVNPQPVRVGYWWIRVRVGIPLPVKNPYLSCGYHGYQGYGKHKVW